MGPAIDAKCHGVAEIHKGTQGIIDAGLEYSFSALRLSLLIIPWEARDYGNLGREAIMREPRRVTRGGLGLRCASHIYLLGG